MTGGEEATEFLGDGGEGREAPEETDEGDAADDRLRPGRTDNEARCQAGRGVDEQGRDPHLIDESADTGSEQCPDSGRECDRQVGGPDTHRVILTGPLPRSGVLVT